MNIFSVSIVFEIQIGNTNEISMNTIQEIFESKLSFDQNNSTKLFFISVKSSSISAQFSPVTI